MTSKIKELPLEFDGKGEVKGYRFRQLHKSGKAYMYEKTCDEGDTSYEVFKRKTNRRFQSVSYPKSNSFGIWAWDIRNYERALERFNELNK